MPTAAGQHARYTYDKNMNYADSTRGIDWRKMDVDHPRRGEHHARRPLVPHLRPGATEPIRPAMNALEICAGVTTARRPGTAAAAYPDPLNGLEVTGAFAWMTRSGDRLESATIDYAYRRAANVSRRCDKTGAAGHPLAPIPGQAEADRIAVSGTRKRRADVRVERSQLSRAAAGLPGLIENITGTQNYEVETPVCNSNFHYNAGGAHDGRRYFFSIR